VARESSARGRGAERAARFALARVAGRVAIALATLEGCGGLAADGPAQGEPELGAPGGEDPDADGRGLTPSPGDAPGASRLDSTLYAIAQDLQDIAGGERRFMRYVVVSHVSNTFDARGDRADTAASDVEGAREVRRLAVTKLVNSVSQQSVIARPMLLGQQRLFQRIDLRHYGWDRPLRVEGQPYRDGWEAIVAHALQGVEFEGPAAERSRQLSGARVPWLMADDFVATTSSGDVYYELLQVPGTLNALQENLGIASGDPELEFHRAGFADSGHSFNPRLVERYGAALGGVWQVLDFADAERGNSIFSAPLSIEADSTSLIFALPNGLWGYAFTDAAGQRTPVSSLPTSVIADPSQSDGLLRNAASCFGCHNAGLLPFRDQMRERLPALPPEALGAEELASALATFPEPSVLEGLAQSDDERYRQALLTAGVPPGIEDPISRVHHGFWDEIGLRQAAGELFVEPGVLRSELSRLPPALVMLGMPSASVTRSAFASAYVEALCILHSTSENRPSGC
jgi:hypothetical protein